jgi:hypothetical protein
MCRTIILNSSFVNRQNIILPVVLYGCETWSRTLREEHGLRAVGNRLLRKILGPKREEITGGRRKLQTEEIHDLYSSPNVIRVIRSTENMKHRQLGRIRCRWEDNIKMDVKEIG